MCLACSDSDKTTTPSSGSTATAVASPTISPRPTPFYETPLDAKNAKWVRNKLGLDDGWTTNEIKYQDAEREKYNKRVVEWQDQNRVTK